MWELVSTRGQVNRLRAGMTLIEIWNVSPDQAGVTERFLIHLISKLDSGSAANSAVPRLALAGMTLNCHSGRSEDPESSFEVRKLLKKIRRDIIWNPQFLILNQETIDFFANL